MSFISSKMDKINQLFCCLFLSITFSINIFAECSGSINVFCNSTIDANIYHDTALGISDADYLHIEPDSGFQGIVNIDNGTWIFNNVNISTDNADALSVMTNATINLYGTLHIDTNNAGAILASGDSNINLNDNVYISTNADNTDAIVIKDGSTINFNSDIILNSFGRYSDAFYVKSSVANIQGASVATVHGNNSHAFVAANGAIINLADNSIVNTKGYNSYAFAASNNSYINIGDNLQVFTKGNNSYALFAYENSNIILGNNSLINANQSHGLFAYKNSGIILNGNAVINATGKNSYAITADEDSNINTNNFAILNIQGDISSSNGASIDLGMSNSSSFIGNTYERNDGKITLSFDGNSSFWQMNNDSVLTNLHITNGAKVDLKNSDISSTLTIANLYGDSGVFYLKVDIDNGSLVGNKIKIDNSSSGNHQIIIDDRVTGSITDAELQMLLIEQSDGVLSNYDANFTLNTGSVDIGQYVYTLNASNDIDNKNFYLSTNGKLNNAALSSIGFLNINYFTSYLTAQTLLQRMGEIRNQQDIQNDIWIKVNTGKSDSFDEKLNITGIDYYGITAGIDNVYHMDSRSILTGIFVDLLKADIAYDEGSGKSDSKAAGVYITYRADDNFYIDFLSKYSSGNNEFDTTTSGGFKINGKGETKGFSVALEGAKRVYLGNFYVEPELALTYSHQGGFTIRDFVLDSFNSIIGRASTLVGYQLHNTNIYVKSGYIKEFDGKTSYSHKDGSQKFSYDINGNFWDNGVGIAMDVKNRHLYLEGTYQKGSNFNNQKINLGYRFVF
jgi:outer membrane autotransporter protein